MNPRPVGISAIWVIAALVLLAGAVDAQIPTQLPPRVIACTPEPFASNVDAGLQHISVTFDHPMATEGDSGFSSMRWAGVFPGVRDVAPTWDDDATTCTLPVQLESDVTYAVSVNSSKRRGFKSQDGVAALSFSWVFATGERTADDFSPYIVSSQPALGATDVDPRLRQIQVNFSRPVAPGDYSWVILKGSGLYPGVRGGPPPQLSDDRLSATLEVRLSPGTVYALSTNDVYYFGYKDTKGRPVLPYGLCFKTTD